MRSFSMSPRRLALCASLLAVACSHTDVTLTGAHYPSRGDHCAFQVFTLPPATGYEEIGTIDVVQQTVGYASTDVAAFKKDVERYVCRAGGDAVLAQANGFGQYIKGTILKATSGPSPSLSAASDGCRYDTQCKGDRICVNGGCVDPPSKTSL